MRRKHHPHPLVDDTLTVAYGCPPLLRDVRQYAAFRTPWGTGCPDAAGLDELWHAVTREALAVGVEDEALPAIGRIMREEAGTALRAGPALLKRLPKGHEGCWIELDLSGPNASAIPWAGEEARPLRFGFAMIPHEGIVALRAARQDAKATRRGPEPTAPVSAPVTIYIDLDFRPTRHAADWAPGWIDRVATDPRYLIGAGEEWGILATTSTWTQRLELLDRSLPQPLASLGDWKQITALLARQVVEGPEQRFPAMPLVVFATLLALARGDVVTSVRGVLTTPEVAAEHADAIRTGEPERVNCSNHIAR